MDAAALIRRFKQGTYAVTRTARGAGYVHGVQTPGKVTTFNAEASVQPASGLDLQRLPEGRRTMETRIFYTSTQLTAGGQSSAYQADIVLIQGVKWEVQHVETWGQAGEAVSFYRCIIQSEGV